MKSLKFIFLFFVFLFLTSYEGFSEKRPIWSVTKSGGGFFGYDYVQWDVGTLGGAGLGWIGVCRRPGLERCKPPRNLSVLDMNDEHAVEYLSEMADSRINDGMIKGSRSFHVQVYNETFSRIYRITWSASEDRQNVIMEVTREDVTI